MNWQDYEEQIFQECLIAFPDAFIKKNAKIIGRYSKRSRQIDILIEQEVGGIIQRIIIDCKLYNKKVDVKEVESFISMVEDIGEKKGILITEIGYSKSALKRAHYNPTHIELDIFSLKELKYFQGKQAIPFAGKNGVFLFAPIGWVIDSQKRNGLICTLYQRGMTLEEAILNREWAYINMWDRKKKNEDLSILLTLQEKNMRANLKVIEIEYLESVKRNDAKTKLRIARIENYPGLELTAFIEFDEFILFCVFHIKEELVKRSIRKAESILRSMIPLLVEIRNEDSLT